MSQKFTGSCLCGEVRFEIKGDFENFYLCHCSRCRKDTGSAHAANLFSSTAKLKWLAGEDKVTVFTLPSTQHTKAFCSICGSALPNLQMDGDLLVVPAGSLDSDVPISPNAHIFVSSKANWDHDLEKLPMLPELPA
ncbi:GFA family protein [Dethiosulfatarculus sandiegensis]|uniref:Aldehyde-activating protein n=1 Tax=Dethiosulfatarculus sandiegensis TaxID=1429043 RepID=A0A0D2JGI4_9BACT|nr:GFA family protein [Dethiosulfatarculus sandiegensis]KIX14851.1 aldehyde-activating protein [Dethiosulfatarculus sandiegensis]